MTRNSRQYPSYVSATCGNAPPLYYTIDTGPQATPGTSSPTAAPVYSEHEHLLGSSQTSPKGHESRISWLQAIWMLLPFFLLAMLWMERYKGDELERQKVGMFWDQLSVGKCESYDSRRYSSTLQHIPKTYAGDRITACMETAARVHGREVKPSWCDNLGEEGVRGYWVVDFDEPGCRPRWNRYKDNGCTASGSGLREIEQHLEHFSLNEAYDWRDVCIKAPADFHGRHFDGPDHCENWGSFDRPEVFGYWRIDDETCR
ncbi:hypothetical protein BDQ17DRAFT_1354825 [Cyathus striatus]|nr:hypothetical protein BDQ17DRAFT_1354825 [Cyathus striatus]